MYPDYFAFSALVGGTAKTISQRQKIVAEKIYFRLYCYATILLLFVDLWMKDTLIFVLFGFYLCGFVVAEKAKQNIRR